MNNDERGRWRKGRKKKIGQLNPRGDSATRLGTHRRGRDGASQAGESASRNVCGRLSRNGGGGEEKGRESESRAHLDCFDCEGEGGWMEVRRRERGRKWRGRGREEREERKENNRVGFELFEILRAQSGEIC